MRSPNVLLSLALAAMCAIASAAATPPPDDRARALAALDDPSPSARAAAVAWFAKNGTAADDILVLPRLGDDDPRVRELAERGTWLLWSRSGDDVVDALMARGARQLDRRELKAAIATYTEVIERKPGFAEGWNKRATAYFLAGDLDRSQEDCEQVLKRNPYHFGALSGYGQLWFQWKRYDKAIEYWQRAMKVNPNLTGLRRNVEMARKLLAESSKSST
ncbi:MAG: tetratricopeptide repeat protein [Burkholderiales bacterium]